MSDTPAPSTVGATYVEPSATNDNATMVAWTLFEYR